jgi:hypothetical protein
MIQNSNLLNARIKALEHTRAHSPALPPLVTFLTLDTLIQGEHGEVVVMLGNIMADSERLQKANLILVEWMEQLLANVTLQGGAVLGWHMFTSEMAVPKLAMEECPSGDAFLAFIICGPHDPLLPQYYVFSGGQLGKHD